MYSKKMLLAATMLIAGCILLIYVGSGPEEVKSQTSVAVQVSNGSPSHDPFTGESTWWTPDDAAIGAWQHDLRPNTLAALLPGNSTLYFDAAPAAVSINGTYAFAGETKSFTYNGNSGTMTGSIDGLTWHFEMD